MIRIIYILVGLDRSEKNYPDVFKVNVNDGALDQRMIKSRSFVRTWEADGNGVVRLGLAKYKDINRLIFRISAEDSWRTLTRYDVVDDEVPFSFEGFSDIPHIIYVSKLDENGRQAFYRYDTEKEEFLEKVAGHDTVDISDLMINRKGEVTGYRYLDELSRVIRVRYRF